eukprot:GILK01007360.1.p1 GENE.GILK01007360.1~~GILK01007360.1.p1  ORF type:complete len:240 (-),score=38.06 GILK01007360.1:98-787(-)
MSANPEVDILIRKHRDHLNHLKSMYNHVEEVAISFAESGDADKVKDLQDDLTGILELEIKAKTAMDALAAIRMQNNPEELRPMFETKLQEFKSRQPSVSQHPRHKTSKEKFWGILHDGETMPDQDDELIVQGGDVPDKCPLTMQPFKEPVSNDKEQGGCGHTYERSAIMDYIRNQSRRKRTVPCPVAGCSNHVTEQRLERNVDVEFSQQRRKKKKRGDADDAMDATQIE